MGSVSEIWLAMTVTVQVVTPGRLLVGVRVKLLAAVDGLTEKPFEVPERHSTVKAAVGALTLSLKVTVMVVLPATPWALLSGVVLLTLGGASTLMVTVSVSLLAPPVPLWP